jgi:hypothetical protein
MKQMFYDGHKTLTLFCYKHKGLEGEYAIIEVIGENKCLCLPIHLYTRGGTSAIVDLRPLRADGCSYKHEIHF